MIAKRTFVLSTALAAIFSALAATSSHAALVTWTKADISTASDVSTNGTLVDAFKIVETAAGSTSVNGVGFDSFVVPDGSFLATAGANYTLSTADLFLTLPNGSYGAPADAPFMNLDAGYQEILGSATQTFFEPFTLTIEGLVAGGSYEFQWWANTSGFGQDSHSASGGGSEVTLLDNTTGNNGGLGQYAIGTFVADPSGIQEIVFGPGVNPAGITAQLNAFQLRLTSGQVAPIPEPTTVLFGLALAGVCFASRRRGAGIAAEKC